MNAALVSPGVKPEVRSEADTSQEAVPPAAETSQVPPVVSLRRVLVKDKHYRSFLKAVSWRATGTVDTIVISFLVTGKIKLAVSIGFIEIFTKIMLFYFHERLWNKIPLGRAPVEDYTI